MKVGDLLKIKYMHHEEQLDKFAIVVWMSENGYDCRIFWILRGKIRAQSQKFMNERFEVVR